jgi:hypothetical protein
VNISKQKCDGHRGVRGSGDAGYSEKYYLTCVIMTQGNYSFGGNLNDIK